MQQDNADNNSTDLVYCKLVGYMSESVLLQLELEVGGVDYITSICTTLPFIHRLLLQLIKWHQLLVGN